LAKKFTRREVLERLKRTIAEKKPIIGAGAGAGLIAKCCELAGIDLVILYATGRSRLMGIGTALIGDPNTVVLELAQEILFVVKDTPVIAGIQPTDPTREMDKLLQQYKDLGFSGVINFPSTACLHPYDPLTREILERFGQGITKELKVMKMACDMDLYTMSYVWNPEDSARFAEVCDTVVCHAGWTTGGLAGKYSPKTLEQSAKEVQAMYAAAKEANPDIIVLAHGGPFAEPEDTRYLYEHTDVVGFLGASSIERIPIERAVTNVVKEFKSIPIKRSEGHKT